MAQVYKAAGNIYGVQNRVDGRKSENELLEKSDNWLKIISRNKSFERNNPFANAAKNVMQVYCGCLTVVEGNQESMQAFNDWAKYAGLQSGQSFWEIYSEIVGVLTWADCLVVLGNDPYALPGTISARIKIIDPLCVETPPKYRNKGIVGGMRVVLGVALDKNDIEIGYYVRKAGTDGNSDSDYAFLPRYDKDTKRFASMLVRAPGSVLPGQLRSLPMLASSMDTLDVLDQLMESAAIEAKTKSTISVMISTGSPETKEGFESAAPRFVNAETGEIADEQKKSEPVPKINFSDIKSGDAIFLPADATPHIINNHGELNLVEQIKAQLKIIAGAIGIPYTALMSDFEKMNFSSGKLSFDKLFRLVEQWNFGPLVRLCDEIYKTVCLEYYLLKGVLPTPDMLECDWVSPSQPDPDPLKSAKANTENIVKNKTLNRSDAVGRRGDNYLKHLKQKKRETEMETEELGAPIEDNFSDSGTSGEPDDDDDDVEDEE